MSEYILKSNSQNTPQRIDLLKTLLEQAENKENHLDKLRQLNFSVTLFIFAGLFGFGLSLNNLFLRAFVALVMVSLMILLSSYDHRLHEYLHGWRRTKVKLIKFTAELINNPDSELIIQTYYTDGETIAEKENCNNFEEFKHFLKQIAPNKHRSQKNDDPETSSRIRALFYLLVRGAFFIIFPFLLIWPKS